MPSLDSRPVRLRNQSGSVMLAIPRAFCQQLGILPGMVAIINITNDEHLTLTVAENLTDGRTPIRRRPTQQPP